mmetsp:Transcript_7501/g.14837  ORF Transcript_7501/g.14837 Transcript_7501/m.14837 type:complete len:247 (-) Transcript_7501:2815-3555(-)
MASQALSLHLLEKALSIGKSAENLTYVETNIVDAAGRGHQGLPNTLHLERDHILQMMKSKGLLEEDLHLHLCRHQDSRNTAIAILAKSHPHPRPHPCPLPPPPLILHMYSLEIQNITVMIIEGTTMADTTMITHNTQPIAMTFMTIETVIHAGTAMTTAIILVNLYLIDIVMMDMIVVPLLIITAMTVEGMTAMMIQDITTMDAVLILHLLAIATTHDSIVDMTEHPPVKTSWVADLDTQALVTTQ